MTKSVIVVVVVVMREDGFVVYCKLTLLSDLKCKLKVHIKTRKNSETFYMPAMVAIQPTSTAQQSILSALFILEK